ncbi:hypothetical protein GOP47_0003279 [Adiantum capillus-veneris]|uniref:Uncharacterized protein n=1 Tax=Adiantum capillus-veneris TaxID=13818 RepID=A0A9D4VBN7_ADICA|nr:hypothetical protein GOP47_0003279 [Adiantum capillus-veneris]
MFQVRTSNKRKVTTIPVIIDLATNDPRPWYLDIYGLQGAQYHKVHFFLASKQDNNVFEVLGQVVAVAVSTVEGHPSIECINIQVLGNIEYCISPKACFAQCMVKDKEVTMFSRGWNANMDPTQVTVDTLHDSIVQSVKNKKPSTKSPRPKSSHPKAKRAKAHIVAGSKVVDESNLDASQEGTSNQPHLRFVELDHLEKEVQRKAILEAWINI